MTRTNRTEPNELLKKMEDKRNQAKPKPCLVARLISELTPAQQQAFLTAMKDDIRYSNPGITDTLCRLTDQMVSKEAVRVHRNTVNGGKECGCARL